MTENFSLGALLDFLDYLRIKGLMKPGTVSARKAAVNNIFGILDSEEVKDLRDVNMDDIVTRFSNKRGTEFKPESIRVYKSRASSSLEDLIRFRDNPLSFKPNSSSPRPKPASKNEKTTSIRMPTSKAGENVIYNPDVGVTFPIPVRPDTVVRIMNLPSDLTKKEASKIANVIMALAQEG